MLSYRNGKHTAPLYDFFPHARAVAPAAESVTSLLEEYVRLVPTNILSSGSIGCWLANRVNVCDAGPKPSATINIIFFGFLGSIGVGDGDGVGGFVGLLFIRYEMTASLSKS